MKVLISVSHSHYVSGKRVYFSTFSHDGYLNIEFGRQLFDWYTKKQLCYQYITLIFKMEDAWMFWCHLKVQANKESSTTCTVKHRRKWHSMIRCTSKPCKYGLMKGSFTRYWVMCCIFCLTLFNSIFKATPIFQALDGSAATCRLWVQGQQLLAKATQSLDIPYEVKKENNQST